MSRLGQTCLGAAAGLLIDRVVGEPPADVHPVAEFGKAMGRVEQALWADRRLAGVAYAAVGVAIGAAGGRLMKSTATAVAVAAAGRELRQVAVRIGEAVASGDLVAARAELPTLVGRDPAGLDDSGIAAAVIESVAENSVDAVIAPAFWGAVAGAPGAAAYRAINTMDAMVGRRNERYSNFGWAAARLDDAANYIPARIFAVLVAVLNQERARQVIDAVRQDAPAHPSPNAGVAEAAMAAALDRELGGPLSYEGVAEERPFLGRGSQPEPDDIESAVRLADRVEIAAVGLLVLIGLIDRLLDRSSG
ncbi:adenosylcobinamide-phosphate synthase CbiB [Candidatus Poriferisocius sp.]|uniref:adenosylcobinamide-phosphate synthase CbiB n=1 Tax=Candidatus Poriferisocius sp. TaxID=3101276 RepID=UPI003B01D4E0